MRTKLKIYNIQAEDQRSGESRGHPSSRRDRSTRWRLGDSSSSPRRRSEERCGVFWEVMKNEWVEKKEDKGRVGIEMFPSYNARHGPRVTGTTNKGGSA